MNLMMHVAKRGRNFLRRKSNLLTTIVLNVALIFLNADFDLIFFFFLAGILFSS